QLEQPRMNRAPDRRAYRSFRGGAARDVFCLADAGHVLDRHFDPKVETLLLRSVDDGHRTVGRSRAVGGELVVDGVLWIGRPGSGMPARSNLSRRGRIAAKADAAEKARDLVERPLRRRQADALRR